MALLFLKPFWSAKIYDELLTGDICNILERSTKKYNLFIIADVFIYIGELQDVFSKIKNRSEEGAIVVFSTEHLEAEDYRLVKQRYRHSKNYIEKILKQNNFNLIDFKTEKLRKDNNNYIFKLKDKRKVSNNLINSLDLAEKVVIE